MKRIVLPLLFLGLLFSGFTWWEGSNTDGIFYASLNRAIHLGQYDGVLSLQEARKHGDFGVGSEEKLGGELVVLDGKAYKIPLSGKATQMPAQTKLAFSAVKFFKADKTIALPRAMSFKELQTWLDSVKVKNAFAAIKVTGRFAPLSFHCYYPQEKPYKPTKDVQQKVFSPSSIEGTMVGFFTPKSALVLNSPVYHFHFIDKARSTGGHVDEGVIQQAQIEIDYADGFTVHLPPAELMRNIDLNQPMEQK